LFRGEAFKVTIMKMKKPAGNYLGSRQKSIGIGKRKANFVLAIIPEYFPDIINSASFQRTDNDKFRITIKIQA
jgi:hypothetical protein